MDQGAEQVVTPMSLGSSVDEFGFRPSQSSTSSSVASMHSVKIFHQYSKSLWLVLVSLPVISICLAWALLTDHGCEDGRRNLRWFQWFYDFIYSFFGVMVSVTVCDVCYLSTGCSNWGHSFRPKFWGISISSGMSTCVALNVFATYVEVHTSTMGWLFGKSTVIFASTAAAFAMLACALWHTTGKKQRMFAVKSWALIFMLALWAFAFYLSNQLFVAGYKLIQGMIDKAAGEVGFWSWSSLYDYSAACLFGGVYIKLWTHAGHWIIGIVRETAPPLQKDRLHFLILLWSELFNTLFGRLILREVQVFGVLLILLIKDSLVHVMDATLKYNPMRMIRMAIREESDEKSCCMRFCGNALSLFLDVDLRLTLEFFFGFRSHSHHHHHLPDESYMSQAVREVISTHHHHISRAHWRISHAEATPDIEASCEKTHNEYPPTVLDWSGAMSRWEEHHLLLSKSRGEPKTFLDPGMKAIQLCESDSTRCQRQKDHEMHSMYWWHQYFCRPGVTRSEVKSYLALLWNCDEWTASREYEAEALCDRMCFVQRNVRLVFVATYLPKIISSIFSVAFLAVRSPFRCTLEAYDLKPKPTGREIGMWSYILIADMIELLVISFDHWRKKLFQEGDMGWVFISHVLWDKVFMALTVFGCIHIVQDTLIASYQLHF